MTTLRTTPAPTLSKKPPMSRRTVATTVGILFVVQMVAAMVGISLIQKFVDDSTARTPMVLGVLLMECSGLAVVAIGLLMYLVLKDVNPRLAVWYPILRITEFAVSTACGAYLLARSDVVPHHLLWVYLPTGAGGIVLTYLLLTSRLVPRAIGLVGLVGYISLTVGVPFDLMGLLAMDKGTGVLLLAPGGLFELVLLPIWLITRGFSAASSSQDLNSPSLVPSR